MTVSLTLAGTLDFNPTTDSHQCPYGTELKLAEPLGDGLPVRGFDPGEDTFQVRQDLNR
jgi:aconitate hydratase